MYFFIPLFISSIKINSSAVCDLKESPGPNFIESQLILAWSESVGDPYVLNLSFLEQWIILWSFEIEDEFNSRFLGIIWQSNTFFN